MKPDEHAKATTVTESRKGHIIIAGTGRAGTSFLVRYLAELGMETHLSSHETPYRKLSSHLPAGTTAEDARGAHDRVADVEKIRVEKELVADPSATTPSKVVRLGTGSPGTAELDRLSLRRELDRLHREHSKLATLSERRAVESQVLVAQRDALARAHNDLIAEHDALARAHDGLIAERGALARAHNDLIVERDALVHDRDSVAGERDGLLASRSWRLTAPLRRMRRRFARQP